MIASSACVSTKHIILPVAVLGVILSMLSISLPGSAAADLPPLPTLSAALRSAGGPVVPAAWAGVWATTDSVHLCSDPTILFTDSGLDTLCTGDPIQDEQGGITLSCSGTVDDTSVDITCTGSEELSPGCTVNYETTIVATRNGDSYSGALTVNATFTPPLCDGSPDICIVTESTGTRVGPEPPDCLSPVEEGTWGRVKAAYYR